MSEAAEIVVHLDASADEHWCSASVGGEEKIEMQTAGGRLYERYSH